MQIDFGQKLVDLAGEDIVESGGFNVDAFIKVHPSIDISPFYNPPRALFLGSAAMNGLVMQFQDEHGLSGEEKLKRWELALRIKRATGPIEVSAEEVTMIKKVIAKAYAAIVSGQAWQMLEGNG